MMQERTLSMLLEMAERGAPTSHAPTPLRSAEEIAREMVSEPTENPLGRWEFWVRGDTDDDSVVVEDYGAKAGAELDAEAMQRIIVRLLERDRAARAEQPRDLAGRIRALVQEYAGRESDANLIDGGEDYWIFGLIVIELNEARVEVVKHGTIPQRWWDEMRSEHSEGPAWTAARRKAADDLERIIREHEAPR